jgi:hypothetical protein
VLDQLVAYRTCGQVREQLQPWEHAADIVTILLPRGANQLPAPAMLSYGMSLASWAG